MTDKNGILAESNQSSRSNRPAHGPLILTYSQEKRGCCVGAGDSVTGWGKVSSPALGRPSSPCVRGGSNPLLPNKRRGKGFALSCKWRGRTITFRPWEMQALTPLFRLRERVSQKDGRGRGLSFPANARGNDTAYPLPQPLSHKWERGEKDCLSPTGEGEKASLSPASRENEPSPSAHGKCKPLLPRSRCIETRLAFRPRKCKPLLPSPACGRGAGGEGRA